MKLSFRVKMVILTVAILSLAIGLNTLISSYIFQKEYSSALRSEIAAIGQGLKAQMDRLLELGIPLNNLVGFEQQCLDLIKKNPKLSYALVEDPQGVILFHNDPAQHGKLSGDVLNVQTFQDIEIPVQDGTLQRVATIRIGYPVQLVAQKTQRLIQSAVGVAALSLILATIALLFGLLVWITRPLNALSISASQLARGDIACEVKERQGIDAIGILSNAFTELIRYFREMAQAATEISQGNLANRIDPKSKHDVLGCAFLEMVHHLQQTSLVMKRIAEGDLSVETPVRSAKDAFGQVIQAMSEGLRALVTQIRSRSERIVATGTTIDHLATQAITIVQNVTDSVERMISTLSTMRRSVENVSKNMEILATAVESTSAATAQMATSSGQIAGNTTNLTHQTHQTITILNETMSALEEVVSNIDVSRQLSQTTTQDALTGQQAVELVIASMAQVHQAVMTAVDVITKFSQRSGDIDAILDVIHNITEQTSLLALNASIIAAQAGEHGRGFAVVADEIRNLSNGVEESTRNIAAIVKSLKEETANVVQTVHEGAVHVKEGVQQTEQARQTLQKIIESAQQSSTVVTRGAETLHQLQASSRRVVSAMEEVNRMIDEITCAANEQKITTQQINQSIAEITQMATQTHTATTDQLYGVQQVLEAAAAVSQLIAQNQESSTQITQAAHDFSTQAQLLVAEVDRFKLHE